ncbi:MAG: DUF1826 domain-containing protein [Pseudomonadota bacterium]
MTALREVVESAAVGVSMAEMPEGLAAIHDPGCAAAIWLREPMESFQAWMDGLAPELLPRTRLILRPDAVREAVAETCDLVGTPEGPERALLIDDTAALAAIFAELIGAPYLRLRYDVITGNACRKFHTDTVRARLVCTYRGTGTQYGIAAAGAEPSEILTVPTASPILLRGTLWPEHSRSGLRHRSPPIEGTGETRLVLVLDPIADPAEEPDRGLLH